MRNLYTIKHLHRSIGEFMHSISFYSCKHNASHHRFVHPCRGLIYPRIYQYFCCSIDATSSFPPYPSTCIFQLSRIHTSCTGWTGGRIRAFHNHKIDELSSDRIWASSHRLGDQGMSLFHISHTLANTYALSHCRIHQDGMY